MLTAEKPSSEDCTGLWTAAPSWGRDQGFVGVHNTPKLPQRVQGVGACPKNQDSSKAQLVFSIFEDSFHQFLPLQPAWSPHPAHPPWNFCLWSPKKMEVKRKEVLGGSEKRLAVALTCRSRALEEKAGMWQERMGHQKGALLFLSSSGQSQPGWFSSPAASRADRGQPRHPPASLPAPMGPQN